MQIVRQHQESLEVQVEVEVTVLFQVEQEIHHPYHHHKEIMVEQDLLMEQVVVDLGEEEVEAELLLQEQHQLQHQLLQHKYQDQVEQVQQI